MQHTQSYVDYAPLALLGGIPAVGIQNEEIFAWPIVTREDEEAVLQVLRRGGMSGTDVTQKFEAEFAAWQGSKYALGFCNGTASIHAAMFACGVGRGDEIICPSVTYWASATPCLSLGATVVFADIDETTLCLDPLDIERHISPRTKAIVVVHYASHPADMDAIMQIAKRHKLKVIEDVSHAQGGLYKGRRLGTIGDAGAMSLMAGKSFAIGEGGILTTDNLEIYERAVAFGHYERYTSQLQTESLRPYAGLPLGGYKHRMHQLSSAVGRVQLKYYDERCAEIRRAMRYFWELLADTPGLRPHWVDESTGSNMAGCYAAMGHYHAEELGGLSLARFMSAVEAEGATCIPCNFPLHLHPQLNGCDIYGDGEPTRIANSDRDLRQPPASLPVSETIAQRIFMVPWFKHYQPEIIERYADAYRKVAANYEALLEGDEEGQALQGRIGLTVRK